MAPQTPFPQQRWATKPSPPTPHLCTACLTQVLLQATSSGTDGDQRREASGAESWVPPADPVPAGTGAGGGGAACGRNQGGRLPLHQADGAPRRPSQVSLPSSPLPVAAPRAYRPPPPAARERSDAWETFNFVLMSSGGVPRRALRDRLIYLSAPFTEAVVPSAEVDP